MKPLVKSVLFFSLALVILTTCDHTLGVTHETPVPTFTVSVKPAANGTVTAVPASGAAGTPVILAVNPAPGYRLKSGGLKRGEGPKAPQEDAALREPPYRFILNDNNLIVAEFEKVTGNYTVTIEETTGGTIAAYAAVEDLEGVKLRAPYGPEGRNIVLKWYPDPGFVLKDGSVKWTRLNAQNKPTANVFTLAPPYEFALPAANVTITAEFESPDAVNLVESGKQALLRDDYDSAVIAFEAAYHQDPENREAIFYSALGQAASIAVDTNVRRILQTVGIANYPGDLNNLLALGDSWDNYYTDDSYTTTGQRRGWLDSYSGTLLPDFSYPSGYYAFQNQQAILQESKINGLPSMATYQLVMFFNLMGSNIENLNYVIDDVLRYALGSSFEAAAARASKLAYNDTFTMDQAIIEKLFLDKWLAGGDRAGRAELDVIFGLLRLFKAGLEWVSSYDIEFDRYIGRLWSYNAVTYGTFFPVFPGLFDELNRPYIAADELHGDSPGKRVILNDILAFMFREMDRYFTEHQTESHRIPDMLAIRNNFLKARSAAASAMDKSKADFIKAVGMLGDACGYYFDPSSPVPQPIQDILDKYRYLPDGLAKLKDAAVTGGTFYVPETLPEGMSAWNFTASNAKHGINMKGLFTPGQLAINRLIELEAGGRRPKFYGWTTDTRGEGIPIGAREDFAQYTSIGFKLNLRALKSVWVQGLEKDGRPLGDTEYVHAIFPDILLTPANGERLYSYYWDLYTMYR